MNEGPIACITGGAGALGSALGELLVERGYRVALFDIDKSRARGDEIAERLGRERVVVHTGDFGAAGTWTAALETTKRAFGAFPQYAALVAGGWAGGDPIHAAKDDSAYERMMKLNVDTVYRALRALLPSMVEAKQGSIVVVGSRAVDRPWTSAGAAAYAASKAAVVTLAETAAAEVLQDGVRINAVLPSTMDTAANRASMPDADPKKWVALSSAAAVIAFLFSDDSRDVSGVALPVYGRV
jgi:NAD(P)-dependent dehydrogenase (short-subunit alcohol dehydrogenase family)